MERISIDLIPGGYKPTCHATQFDDGRVIRFDLFNRRVPYTLISGESVEIKITKPNGAERTEYVANTQSSYVDWTTVKETCDVAGDYSCKLVVSKDGKVIGSGNFTLAVEIDAYGDSTITVQTASGAIATFTTNIIDLLQEVKCEINAKQDLHGYEHPWSAGGGKNKLNYDKWKQVNIVKGTAVWENNGVTLTATSGDCYTSFAPATFHNAEIPVSEGETVILSWEETTNKSGMVFIFPNGDTTGMVSVSNTYYKSVSYTVEEGVSFITFRFGVNNQGDTISYKNIQVNKGTQESTWTPYANICPIVGIEELNIRRTGVNLWDETWVTGGIISDGSIDTSLNNRRTTSFITVPDNSTVYMACPNNALRGRYAFYDSAKNLIYYDNDGPITNSISTPSGAKYMRITLGVNYGTTYNNDISINYPSTDTTYHPYNGQTYAIAFGQTVYGGVLDVTRGKLKPCVEYPSYNGETLSGRWLSSEATYIEGTTPPTGSQVVSLDDYGSDIDLTPEQIEALLGVNNVYSNTGDTEVKYLKKDS